MRSRREFLPITFLILAVMFLVPSALHPASGQLVGLICLSPSPSTGACPAPPVTISSPVGTQMSVSVIVQGSDSLNGFAIILKADHTIIKPAGANLAGSILSGGSIVSECIGGVLKAGYACSPTDTVDTIELAAIGPFNYVTFPGTTGLLFTAIYNVTGTTTTPLSFQTGCLGSGVIGTTICVFISNGTPFSDVESVQGANYVATPTPDFTITATPSNLGNVSPCFRHCPTVTVNVTSTGGFTGTVTLSASTPSGVTASFNPNSVTVSSGGFATSTLTLSFSCPGGSPPVTAKGQSGSLAHNAYVTWNTVTC